MRTSTFFLFLGLVVMACFGIAFSQPSPWPEVTKESKPWSRWWWMGNAVDEGTLGELMRQYHDAGLGGLEIAPIYGAKGYEDRYIPYLSPRWMEVLQYTVNEADRLGMGIDLTTGTGWPFGGPQVSPNEAAAKAVFRIFQLEGGKAFDHKIIPDDPRQQTNGLQSLTAYNEQGKAFIITDRVNEDGTLLWKPENGRWELYAVFSGNTGQQVKRAAPGGEGYTLNHFSKEALDVYLTRFDEAFAGHPQGIRAFYNDSYEVYGADWTPDLYAEFEKRRGYDLRLHIRDLLSDDTTARVARLKSDYRQTISEMLLNNFTLPWTAWAHRYGSKTKNQAHGSPANLLDLYAAVDIPEIETFGSSDFAIPGFKPGVKPSSGDRPNPMMMKFASSAAHLTGKKLVSSETFTWLGEHFMTSLAQCKPEVEQCFLAGINHVFYHGITYSPPEAPWPGWLFYAAMNVVPTNSWWPHLSGLNTYISRVQAVLQEARSDNEVLLYWPVYDLWDDPTGMLKTFTVHNADQWLHSSAFYECAKQLEEKGYGVDFVSDGLLADLTVSQSKLQTKEGKSYQALLIPYTRRMPLETLRKIDELAEKGVTVIFQTLPEDVPGLGDYAQRNTAFKQIIENLGRRTTGKIQLADQVVHALQANGLIGEPLVSEGLKYVRLKKDGHAVYYVVNHGSDDIDKWITFNTEAQQVMLMDPQTGSFGLGACEPNGPQTAVRLQLRAGETLFLQFSHGADTDEQRHWSYCGKLQEEMLLNSNWSLSFKQGGPKLPHTQKLDRLLFWTDLPGDDYANFSGIGVYETEFSLDTLFAGHVYELVCHDLAESAKVFVNDREAGLIWSVPYRLAIDTYLRKGVNKIRIEVANLMANRIRYMDRNHMEWRRYHEINFVNLDYKPFDASSWDIQPSGIAGSVTIRIHRKENGLP